LIGSLIGVPYLPLVNECHKSDICFWLSQTGFCSKFGSEFRRLFFNFFLIFRSRDFNNSNSRKNTSLKNNKQNRIKSESNGDQEIRISDPENLEYIMSLVKQTSFPY